jgi:hypothetical protein
MTDDVEGNARSFKSVQSPTMMENALFRLFRVSPSRIPQLYYGASASRRQLTGRERLAEALFQTLQIISHILLIIGGILGYIFYQVYGLILFAALGYLMGVWIRRSLGIRGRKHTTGFFMRMRERAQGSKPGLLEWVLEKVSQNEFTRAECRTVTQIYDKAVKQLKGTNSTEEQNRILADLDRKVFQILHDQDR